MKLPKLICPACHEVFDYPEVCYNAWSGFDLINIKCPRCDWSRLLPPEHKEYRVKGRRYFEKCELSDGHIQPGYGTFDYQEDLLRGNETLEEMYHGK